MHDAAIVLYIIAAICFTLGAFTTVPRVNMIALGLLAWVLVPLIVTVRS